ncbi:MULTISPECIES: hypothetical protein [Nocardia]|nr:MULTISPECIES: hypothetical protein [Nocardia]
MSAGCADGGLSGHGGPVAAENHRRNAGRFVSPVDAEEGAA